MSTKPKIEIRDRIRELRRVPASKLMPNLKNWHPDKQKRAMRAVLQEIGYADAQSNPRPEKARNPVVRKSNLQPDKARDPVCGILVEKDPQLAAEYKGKTYYFCSNADRDKFKRDPQKYVKDK